MSEQKEGAKPKKELTKKELVALLEEQREQLLRTAAEYDNFRKRTQKEKIELYGIVAAETAAKMLPVVDSLELALCCKTSDAQQLKEGLELTLKQLKKCFEEIGIAEIEATVFDPNLHDAVMHIEDESLGEGVVAEVMRKGYKLGDKVLRHATVKVAN